MDDQDDTSRRPDDGSPAEGKAQEGLALIAIGLPFFVLGITGLVGEDTGRIAFLAIGVVFMSMYAGMATRATRASRASRSRRSGGAGSVDGGGDVRHGDGDGDAGGHDGGGHDGGGGDGGGGGGD